MCDCEWVLCACMSVCSLNQCNAGRNWINEFSSTRRNHLCCLSQISMTCIHICRMPYNLSTLFSSAAAFRVCAGAQLLLLSLLLIRRFYVCVCVFRFSISFILFFLARNGIVSHVVGAWRARAWTKNTSQFETIAFECTDSKYYTYYSESKHTPHIPPLYRFISSKVNCFGVHRCMQHTYE